jgi:hypothetical protein
MLLRVSFLQAVLTTQQVQVAVGGGWWMGNSTPVHSAAVNQTGLQKTPSSPMGQGTTALSWKPKPGARVQLLASTWLLASSGVVRPYEHRLHLQHCSSTRHHSLVLTAVLATK